MEGVKTTTLATEGQQPAPWPGGPGGGTRRRLGRAAGNDKQSLLQEGKTLGDEEEQGGGEDPRLRSHWGKK